MHSTDISDWNIDFIDTGLSSTIGERLMRVRPYVEDEEMFLANYADTLTDAPLDEMIDVFRAARRDRQHAGRAAGVDPPRGGDRRRRVRSPACARSAS